MDGIVDSCVRMVEVDGRFEIELIEQKQSLESYSNRQERAEAIAESYSNHREREQKQSLRELQQSSR